MKIFDNLSEEQWLSLRREDLTSTEAAVLFDASPYETRFELWHRKAGNIDRAFSDNERMTWGRRLEAVIAEGIADDHGFSVRPFKAYVRDEAAKMGSSFDFEIVGANVDSPLAEAYLKHGDGLFEIKNVDGLVFRNEWLKDGDTLEAPLHIELQVQHQLAVSGRAWACIGVLVGGNTSHLVVRERNEKLIEKLREKVSSFWSSVEANEPPDPNYAVDLEALRRLYANETPQMEVGDNRLARLAELAERYVALSAQSRELDAQKKTVQAEIVDLMGEAELAQPDGFKLTFKTQKRKGYVVEPTESRVLRVSARKAA